MSLESFKLFVRSKPNLVKYVNNKEMSWQEFYDLYELYGPNNSIWDKYNESNINDFSFKNILSNFKNINMDEVQKGISSLQKGVDYLKDIVKDNNENKDEYEPRPIYKHFDD